MTIDLPMHLGINYKSSAQRARVVTEAWAGSNLFCPNCMCDNIYATPANTRAVDFRCNMCLQLFQLKGKGSPLTDRIVDGAYEAMISALSSDSAPNLYLLRYDPVFWRVSDVILVPHFALSCSAIERRKPLSPTARRAGWVGCFINLSRIPPDARISVIRSGKQFAPSLVREEFRRLKPLKQISPAQRGWTLDVLNLVRELGVPEFCNEDVYVRSRKLEYLYPANAHIKDKIRQQLQILRDAGFLTHTARGRWRLSRY